MGRARTVAEPKTGRSSTSSSRTARERGHQSDYVRDGSGGLEPDQDRGNEQGLFGGPQTKAVHGRGGLKLYAPATFDIASISHSDDDAPEIASQTFNMTAAQDFGRNARGFHVSELAVMRDLGFDTIATTAQIIVTPTGGNTTVLERTCSSGCQHRHVRREAVRQTAHGRGDRCSFDGERRDESRQDAADVHTSNWNTPQTVTVTGVTDGVVSESRRFPCGCR